MRLNNDRDQAFVKAAMPEGARGFLDSIPALRNRECIICGEGVSIPIRVAFDNLEENKRPASEDPSFVELWNQSRRRRGNGPPHCPTLASARDQISALTRPVQPCASPSGSRTASRHQRGQRADTGKDQPDRICAQPAISEVVEPQPHRVRARSHQHHSGIHTAPAARMVAV